MCNSIKFSVAFTILAFPTSTWSQSRLTFHQDIEPIIVQNCQPCHKPNHTAPFNLLTYEDVKKRGKFIANVTKTRYMPPWKADPEFQQYAYERRLSSEDIQKIQTWVETGMTKGKPKRSKAIQTIDTVPVADLILEVSSAFKISTDNKDDYRFFSLPTNLPHDTFLSSIEFVPGNPRLVHHSRLMTDTTSRTRGIDGLSAEDPKIRDFDKYPPLDRFFYGWVPGNDRFNFPAGSGKNIHKNTDFILNIHYSPNSQPNLTDHSKIKLYFSKTEVKREVFSLTIEENSITNQPFLIKANTKPTFYASLGPVPYDISAIAVLPHMHYIGKSFKAFAVTPEGDAIHLIKIDDWDFRWQNTYQFKKLLRIPKNSVLLIEAVYDNTDQNPENQFSPPQDISYGWGSKSEMMNLVLYYLTYQPGDETKSAN